MENIPDDLISKAIEVRKNKPLVLKIELNHDGAEHADEEQDKALIKDEFKKLEASEDEDNGEVESQLMADESPESIMDKYKSEKPKRLGDKVALAVASKSKKQA